MIPGLGPLSAVSYIRHPARLLTRGAELGPIWTFRHPRLGRIPVIRDRALARAVLSASKPGDAARLVPWLGSHSPWTATPEPRMLPVIGALAQQVLVHSPSYYVDRALRPLRAGEVIRDIGPDLRHAALAWLVGGLCKADAQRTRVALAAAMGWQREAAALALMLPELRPLQPLAELDLARVRLIGALAGCSLGRALDGPIGLHYAGIVMAILGPIADALPMLAMQALVGRERTASGRTVGALHRDPPIPLLLLEAHTNIELGGGVILPRGRTFGVDVVRTALTADPPLIGEYARGIARVFTVAVLATARERKLRPRWRKSGWIRLCWGPTHTSVSLRARADA